MKRLEVCLLSVTALALSTALLSTGATAETWKQAPGDTKSYYDADFTRVDQATGLIVTRVAEGKPNGPYKNWPPTKGPILVFALGSRLAGHTLPGWTSTVVIVSAVGAVQLLALGILGEYVGRMYAAMQGRPTYFVAHDSLGEPEQPPQDRV